LWWFGFPFFSPAFWVDSQPGLPPKELPPNFQPFPAVRTDSTKMRHVLCAPQMEGEMDPEKNLLKMVV